MPVSDALADANADALAGAAPAVGESSPARRRAAPMAPEQRRAAIIEATIPLLYAHGFDVTTRQIADAAGVAEGTIFRVFDDKEGLLRAAVDVALSPGEAERRIERIDPGLDLHERILAAATILQDRMTAVLELASAVGHTRLAGAGPGHPDHYAGVKELLTGLFEPDRDHLRHTPQRAAHLLQVLSFAGSHPRLTDGDLLTPSEIVDVLLYGISLDADPSP